MTAEKILKYDVIGKLSKFAPVKDAVYGAMFNEQVLDSVIQPDQNQAEDSQTITNDDLKGK